MLTEFLKLRVAVLWGWENGIDFHERELRKMGQAEEPLLRVRSWPEESDWGEAATVALALCDAISLHLSEELCEKLILKASSFFDPPQILALVLAVISVNDWLRFGLSQETNPSLAASLPS